MKPIRIPPIDLNAQRSDLNSFVNGLTKDLSDPKLLQNLNKDLTGLTSRFSEFCQGTLKSFSEQWNSSPFLKNVSNTLSDLADRISKIKITIERPEATPHNIGIAALVAVAAAGVWWWCTKKDERPTSQNQNLRVPEGDSAQKKK